MERVSKNLQGGVLSLSKCFAVGLHLFLVKINFKGNKE